MTDGPPPLLGDYHRLRFSCACCSAVPIAEDPWVAIVNQRKLNDGTKELILDAIYRQPRTITQLAELLGISAPAVHRHAGEMLASELISEVGVTALERSRASERYYGPNFPVVLASDQVALQPVLEDLAADIATAFQRRQDALWRAHSPTRACTTAANPSTCCSNICTPQRPAGPGSGWKQAANCPHGPSTLIALAGSGGPRSRRNRRAMTETVR
jgi:DNA-binding transcriptional ArsR family regulator